MWILMSVTESTTHKEGQGSEVRVVAGPLSVALGVSQSINNPARPTSHRLVAKVWSYHPGRGPIDGCGQLDCANVGWIKSKPSRILRPVPRRRAIVAPRFGKWARVTETSMGRKPTRPDQLPRLVFSVPCSGIRSRRRGNTLFHHCFKLCYVMSRQTAHRPDGCNGDLPFLSPRHLVSLPACLLVLSEHARSIMNA